MNISNNVRNLSAQAMIDIAPQFALIDDIAQMNTEKVLGAFQHRRVSDVCFNETTGYGYNDRGREVLDQLYGDMMGTDAALVRAGFVNGTHAITAALFAALRPGDTLLSATSAPYDTLRGVIGITGVHRGSLREYGILYSQVALDAAGKPDFAAIAQAIDADNSVSAVFIQRSRGYSQRPALTVAEIGQIVDIAHRRNLTVIVDNCYGEFTETIEPGSVGADLIAGSLIKNPGGGIAPAGGYVAGREDLVEAAAFRLTAPGIGAECGATLGVNRLLFQGLFMAPHVTAQAMKTAVFCARLFELLGYKTSPGSQDMRSDIIQTVELGSPELLQKFCRGIQMGAPVDSFVTPEPWDMPGYDCPVIMAAGAFIQGASIELSADAPLREPYRAYLQGGITFESGKLGIMLAASAMERTP
ncbi:MAG: methionine gamma-lyase family protein [Oscillospiraceae bacterium]|nr:methionine gamma-lyase family protein [Oscillospiraceae bacterium]